MNILFLDLNDSIEAGVTQSMLNAVFIEAMNRRDDVNVITAVHPAYQGVLRDVQAVVHEITYRSKIDIRAIKKIASWIDRYAIDLIHCQGHRPLSNALMATYMSYRKPKVIARRGILRKVRSWDPIEWLTLLHPRYDHTIALSNAIANDLVNTSGFDPRSITTIYQAWETSWLNPVPSFNLRKHLGIDEKALIIGTVANYRPVKGLELLMHVIKKMAHHDIHWVIIGKHCAEHLEPMIRHLPVANRVHFCGFDPCPDRYVKDFDLYIQPSLSEGLSYALIQAMLLGVCAIVSHVGGMPELISHQDRGLLFKKNDPDDLIACIIYAMSNREHCNRMSACAQTFARDQLALERIIDQTYALYCQLLFVKPQIYQKV